MFLRCSKRRKDGKEHLYWSVVENRRRADQRVVQRHVLYLGELNGVQESSWRKTVELFGQDDDAPQQVALFPEEHAPAHVGVEEFPIVRVRLAQMALRRPRQWGACWLGLGEFWRDKFSPGREGTRWDQVLQTLVLYRFIDPGSEWRLHRHWFEHTALADLIGGDFDLALRPIHHQLAGRIEAHLFVSFLAYCLQVTLKARLRRTASGLTPRAVLEKFATVQMIDVHLPTTDGREIVMARHTQPEKDLQLLLDQLKLALPAQGPPKIQAQPPAPPVAKCPHP